MRAALGLVVLAGLLAGATSVARAQASDVDAPAGAPAGGTPGTATDEADAFYAAIALARDGKHAEAAAAHVALVDRSPADAFADDALSEAAQLYEEHLHDPVRALALYERLLREYPASRLAVRAQRRADTLRRGLGPDAAGAEAQRAWSTLIYEYPSRTRAESIALAERLLAEHPGFAEAPHVLHWLGEQELAEGLETRALARWTALRERYPESEWAPRALRSIADLYVRLGRWDEAERAYASLLASQRSVAEQQSLTAAVERLRFLRSIARWAIVAWLALAAALIAALAVVLRDQRSPGGAARALVRPPLEALYVLPVAALFVLAGRSENERIAGATLWLGLATVAVAWMFGATIASARATRGAVGGPRLVATAFAAALAMFAAAFLVIVRHDLLDLVVHTIRFGSE